LRNSDTLAKNIAREFEQAGQNVRKYYQRRLPSNPAKDYYYILRDTPNNETVIIEYGFADSSGDDIFQLKNNWEELAEAVVKAVTEYVGGNYVAPSGSNYYTVQKGESLWSIAKKLGVTVNELKEANNLTSNLLNIGQNLIIPSDLDDETLENIYIVKSGDSLYSIANKYNTNVNKLKELNNLTSNILQIGQKLVINDNNNNNNNNNNIDDNIYTVQKGDSLYSIANKYNTTVNELKSLNNLSSNNLSIGQKLKIPNNNSNTYTVKSGDSLYSIATKYNTSVDALKSANNLTSNFLSIGQKLIIPEFNDQIIYTVKSGDNLYAIARNFNTSVDKIINLNNLETINLSIGQQLLIP